MKTVIFFVLFICSFAVYAQKNDVVQGIVSDNNKLPLPFVTVIAVSDDKEISSCLADANGHYKLEIPNNVIQFTIRFSYVGYKLKEIKVDRRENKSDE